MSSTVYLYICETGCKALSIAMSLCLMFTYPNLCLSEVEFSHAICGHESASKVLSCTYLKRKHLDSHASARTTSNCGITLHLNNSCTGIGLPVKWMQSNN